ncbi:hypothetical protein ADL27_31785, partial [Streptomyces sp. NRRL F-6602]
EYGWLADAAPGDQPLYALRPRGMDTGATELPDSLARMAADYVAQIRTVQPSGPYHLLGWSFGGLVAHAVACLLQDAGERVERLVLLDSHVLADLDELPPAPEGAGARQMYGALLDFAEVRPPGVGDDELDDARFLGIVRDGDSLLSDISERHL